MDDHKSAEAESKTHGSWQFETLHEGRVVFRASGVYHSFIPNRKIIRTFEMENENTAFPVQLAFLEFAALTADTSKLNMHIIYKSVYHRNEMMKLPFAYGINMAHDKLQTIANKLK
jgi:uncharacterized protein YndB with AHSA1/START domain